jgi:hypothetical protein
LKATELARNIFNALFAAHDTNDIRQIRTAAEARIEEPQEAGSQGRKGALIRKSPDATS